ncbi:MAG: transposase [Spirochaetaceae bacterium]|jgi:hypothetical protein|nr:transposase [Spirochaetaceae bacterium]
MKARKTPLSVFSEDKRSGTYVSAGIQSGEGICCWRQRCTIENDTIVDAKIETLKVDERTLAKGHIEALSERSLDFGGRKPVMIFDRGYPSRELISYLEDKGIRYVLRVAKRFSARIDSISGGSQVVELPEGISVRAVVFRLKSGERGS